MEEHSFLLPLITNNHITFCTEIRIKNLQLSEIFIFSSTVDCKTNFFSVLVEYTYIGY